MSAQAIPNFTMAAAGGACFVCKMPRREGEQVLDTGIDIDFEGALQICEACVGYWAGLLGMVTRDQQALINADLVTMANEVEVARRFMARYEEDRQKVQAEYAALRKISAIERGLDAEVRKVEARA